MNIPLHSEKGSNFAPTHGYLDLLRTESPGKSLYVRKSSCNRRCPLRKVGAYI